MTTQHLGVPCRSLAIFLFRPARTVSHRVAVNAPFLVINALDAGLTAFVI
jgi:hypothetical protein